MMRPLVNISLRALTLVSKFLLVFVLAKFLPPADVGVYGLIAAAVGYGIYLIGLEFYVFANREIIGISKDKVISRVRDQGVLYIAVYVAASPLFFLVESGGWIPQGYILWLVLLLLLEHVAQELNRILITQGEQVLASIVLFIRSGAWGLVSICLMTLAPASRSVYTVFAAWAIGGICACLLGLSRLAKYDRRGLNDPVDWAWIRSGLRVALPFLVASLALKAIFTFDRYFVESAGGLEVLGAYVVFVGMAMAVISFLDAGVFDFAYPRLVALAKAGDDEGFRQAMRNLSVKTVAFVTVLVVCCYLVAQPVVGWIGRPIYAERIEFLQWLLLAVLIASLSYIPHLGLYARRKDAPIIFAQVTGFAVFVIVSALGVRLVGVMAVPWAICLAYAWILTVKLLAFAFTSSSPKHQHSLS